MEKEDKFVIPLSNRKREYAAEILNELDHAKDRNDAMQKIIKREKRTVINIIQNILLFVAIGIIVYAQIKGTYERTEIVMDCRGNLRTINGLETNKTWVDIGYEQQWNTNKSAFELVSTNQVEG